MTEIRDTIREHSITLTVNRTTEETVVRGYAMPGTTAVANIEGHMQPLSPKELRMVPEGMNTMEWHHIWALDEIKEDDLIDNGSAPVVKVKNVEFWKEAPFWHGQGVVVKDVLIRLKVYEAKGIIALEEMVPVGVGTFGP